MTIELATRIDEEATRADLRESPADALGAALQETYFVVPTRFVVADVDLLAFAGACKGWRPPVASRLRTAPARRRQRAPRR